jgi:hypothetical protein
MDERSAHPAFKKSFEIAPHVSVPNTFRSVSTPKTDNRNKCKKQDETKTTTFSMMMVVMTYGAQKSV